MTLLVAPCSHKAAKYAVENWHYSQRVPHGRSAHYGVWEDDRFIGSIIFGHAANNHVGKPYGLTTGQIVELTRVALRAHRSPVSQVVAQAMTKLREVNPGTRLVVSFADPEQGHHGGIYQAGNWFYAGMTSASDEYLVNGKRYQGRALRNTRSSSKNPQHGQHPNTLSWARAVLDPQAQKLSGSAKHRYLYPLDKATRRRVAKLAKPYPRAVEASTVTRSGSTGESQVQLPATAPVSEVV